MQRNKLNSEWVREMAETFISNSNPDIVPEPVDRIQLAEQLRAAGDEIPEEAVERVAEEIERLTQYI